MTTDDFERGRASLDALLEWWDLQGKQTRNEATTRFHLIDEILTNVLRWRKDHMRLEDPHGGQYADYALGEFATRLIVEAKRDGIYFELPAGVASGPMDLKTVMESDEAVAAAVRQVCDYCLNRGVPCAAFSNGHQVVAFLGSRQDGVPPLSGRALVFTSLDAMRADFQALWDNLSPDGVARQTLVSTLSASDVVPPPPKLSSRIAAYPGYWQRNAIQGGLEALGNLVLLDILSAPELEDDFLAQCYSSNHTLSDYALVSKEILEARYAALASGEDDITPVPAGAKGALSRDLKSDLLAASLGRRPLLLVGDVGVGKSIFIRHFRRVDAREIVANSIVLSLDFGQEPALSEDLETYVMEHFTEQLAADGLDIESDKFVRNVYKGELQSLETSVYGRLKKSRPEEYEAREIDLLSRKLATRDRHLQASLKYATKTQKRQVIVFLDNIDQRDFDFQERVFLIGQSLAQTWPATVFLSLRPETFYRSRTSGSLTAYQPRVFTIAPPNLGEVIQKRIAFCQGLVLRPETRHELMPTALDEQADRLRMYLKILDRSFKRRPQLLELVDNLSGGNIRAALGFLNTFVGSGHVNTTKIFEIEEADANYKIALHEFVRAIIYGDHVHYNPTSSPIANVFEISTNDGRQHFLIPIVLAFVERSGQVAGVDGYVGLSALMTHAQGVGFAPKQVEFALDLCVQMRLLHTPGDSEGRPTQQFRITTAGAYTYKRLMGTFVYLDAMVVDTPIVDPAIAGKVDDVREVEERLVRAEVFIEYLNSQWTRVRGEDLAFDWDAVVVDLRKDMVRARRSAARWRSPDLG